MRLVRYFNALVLYPLSEKLQGRAISSKLANLRRESLLPYREAKRLALNRLREVLRRAGTSVPYYRDLFRAKGFKPDRVINEPGCLESLPFLTKEIIREQGDRLLDQEAVPHLLHVRKTGGSTGPSAVIRYSQDALDWTAAVNRLVLEWAGKRPCDRELHFSSLLPVPTPRWDEWKECIKCAALNRTNLHCSAWDEDNLEDAWRQLHRSRPFLVHGYPSILHALALYVRRHDLPAQGVFRVFESTGEALDARKRRTIEEVFACRVVNRYGGTEFGVVAYETPDSGSNKLKLLDGIVWTETLRGSAPVPELVFTSLRNEAMPLIRYRIGDLGELEETDSGLYLKNLIGRVHDVVCIDGKTYPTHFIQDILGGVEGIDEFQFERRGGQLVLRLVVPDVHARAGIEQKLRCSWTESLPIEFISWADLKRHGWRAKFRYLVDEVDETDGQDDLYEDHGRFVA
jgi:phenylacetate-CoA ligase